MLFEVSGQIFALISLLMPLHIRRDGKPLSRIRHISFRGLQRLTSPLYRTIFMNIHTKTKCQIILPSGSSSRGSALADCVSGWLFKASCCSSNESHFQRRVFTQMAVGEEKAAAASNTPLFCCEEMRGVLALSWSFTMDVCLNSRSERCFIPSVWVIYIYIAWT